MQSPSLTERGWALAPSVLRVVAEAGWLTVLYAAMIVAGEHRAPLLGPIELGLLVVLGMAVVWAGRRGGSVGPLIMLLGIALGGLSGWLADPDARQLVAFDLGAALGTHGGGWLGAVAVVRGALLMRRPDRAAQAESVLAWALPLLALVWVVSVTVAPRAVVMDFVLLALWGTVLFVAGALTTLGLARLEALEPGIADPRLRRRLRHLVVGAGLAVLPLAVPFAVLSGLPVERLFGPIIGPFRALIGLVAIFFGFLADALINALSAVVRPSPELVAELRRRSSEPGQDVWQGSELADLIVIGVVVFVLMVFALLVIELARWLLGKRGPQDDDDVAALDDLERTILVPSDALRPAGAPAVAARQRLQPRDAVTAYLGALHELEVHPTFMRVASETPGQHASRVHELRMPGAAEMSRLAADYQLARYAKRPINAAEDRRALGRLERLRRLLRS